MPQHRAESKTTKKFGLDGRTTTNELYMYLKYDSRVLRSTPPKGAEGPHRLVRYYRCLARNFLETLPEYFSSSFPGPEQASHSFRLT